MGKGQRTDSRCLNRSLSAWTWGTPSSVSSFQAADLVEFLATIKLPEREVQSLICEDEVEFLLIDTNSVRSAASILKSIGFPKYLKCET